MEVVFLIGRILFASIFIISGAMNHLMNLNQATQYAESKNVPAARIMVIVTGVVILLGGLGILLGIWYQISSILLFLFLIAAMYFMHNFWAIDDPQQKQAEMVNFMKNLVIAGGCLIIFWLAQSGVDLPLSVFP